MELTGKIGGLLICPLQCRYSSIPSHKDPATKTSVEHLGQGQLEVPVQRTSSITVPPRAI